MSQVDDALKAMAEALNSAVAAINKLIDADATDRAALDAAKTQIVELQNAAASTDGSTAQAIGALTTGLQQLAERALAAVPGDVPW